MRRERLAHVLRIIAVDVFMLAGVLCVYVDVVSYADRRIPHPIFGVVSVCGLLVFAASLTVRIFLHRPGRD